MSLDNITSITDITDAIKALSEKTSALESELSACQSEVSRLNRVNSRLLADNTKLEKLVRLLESEIEKLGGKRVEKDSTNSSIPPSQQSIAAQAALRTRSLREPSGRTSGRQQGHEGHELAKTDSPSSTEEHKAKVVYMALLSYIAKEKCAGMDETGVYINKALCWFWCLQCSRFTFVFADPSRGIEALKKHGILEHLANLVLCTDRHSTYFNLDVLTHQFCLVHLIRNLQYLSDINSSQKWSSEMQQLFRDAIHESNNAEAPPGKEARNKYEERLDKLLDEDVGHYGKDFRQLQNGIIKCRDFLFTFLDHEGVPHHNNASEAAVRILKVKTKVSGGFRTQDGADEYAVFHSITDTAKKNGKSKFNTLYLLITEEAPDATFIDKYIV